MNPTTPQSYYDDPKLTQARTAYETAERAATSAQSAETKLPDMLREALTKKFSADNPLVQNRESALQNYLTVNAQAPLDVTHKSAGGLSDVIYSPLEQSALIERKRASATAPLSTANYLLQLAEGGMGNIIDAGTRAAQAQTIQRQGEAKLKRQSYTDILDELSRKADEAWREKEFNEKVRQFNVSQSNKGSGTAQDKTSEVWQNLVNNSSNEYDIWKAINSNQAAYKAAGVDVQQLWNNHKSLAQSVGKGGAIPDSIRTAKGATSMSSTQIQKNKQNVTDIQTGMAAIQQARQALEKSSSGIQYSGYGLRAKLPFGGISQEAKDTNAALASANTNLFKIAGTQFPKNEAALLGGIVLGIDKSKGENISSLQKSQERLNNQYASLRGIDPTDVNALRNAGYNEDQIYEYLKSQ